MLFYKKNLFLLYLFSRLKHVWIFYCRGTIMNFDVFFSYNRNDKLEVIEIAENLKARGLKVWVDEWELRPGDSFQVAIEKMIKETNAVAIFVGDSGIGHWENTEMRACIQQFVERGMIVIPVILSNVEEEPKLPLFLSGLTWVDFRKGSKVEALARLEWGITGRKPQSYQNLVHPLYQHERDFLQTLLSHFSLLRLNEGIKLEVCFDHDTPAISKREARRYLRKNINNFCEKAKNYGEALNNFIIDRKGEACNINDPEFLFRYASGGTLPIIRLNNIDYY